MSVDHPTSLDVARKRRSAMPSERKRKRLSLSWRGKARQGKARQGKARQGKRDGKGSLSNDGRARKLATFAPRKSYEGFVAELLMNIKGHYNGDKLWPLSRAIFMLSIPRNVEPLKIQGSNHND
uniref:Uncharacterized protein n=1 Tax=Vespula pensylvanica TaxID=30213 RepID=A0A834N7U7_VESPE|nr:hypothetical protein H0235_015787 [Vespula pensylvanica]